MKKITKLIEKGIVHVLIVMMSIILVLATLELGYYLVKNIVSSEYLLLDLDDLMDLFGVFLLVLIGIELLDTIKVYLKENQVHVEVVVLVAIIALARKIVILKIEELDGETIIGIGVLIVALAIAYYLIKKAGLMICNFEDDDFPKEKKPPEKMNP
ncbi:MAG TPA: phosphate-starvation-inducible PsiE family protein [Tangfeifania sp.]|nr:phosphate-starvation-inducible PsiE family protein [Tangfeifania sp.]